MKAALMTNNCSDLPMQIARRKQGSEHFHNNGSALQFDLLSFWRWNCSDVLSNATRGRVAEYLVARALGLAEDSVRNEWDAYDLKTPGELKIEVKSAAYLQSWFQKAYSPIVFSTRPTRRWDATTNIMSSVAKRQADVYVFALFKHRDKETADPLNVDQWEFYVLPTRVLDARTRSQHSITLKSLSDLCRPVPYFALSEEVRQVGSDSKAAIEADA